MQNGFVKVGAAMPKVHLADAKANIHELILLTQESWSQGIKLIVFPELCITGYSCRDLFFSTALLSSVKSAINEYLKATKNWEIVSVIGAPLLANHLLYNCAVVCYKGRILGIVPKQNIPNYNEYYEARQFADVVSDSVIHADDFNDVPFGTNIIFSCAEMNNFQFGVEICEDLWTITPPSSELSLAGAIIICNLSASNEVIGKSEYRSSLVCQQSARSLSAYIYSNCGYGESSTDIVFSGHSLICENGTVLTERKPFDEQKIIATEIDTERLEFDRRKNTSFRKSPVNVNHIEFHMPLSETFLTRKIDPMPFVPSNFEERDQRCNLILNIQSRGLAQRIEASHSQKAVIGISGGLDSALALLVIVKAMDYLNRSRSNIIAVTMPCFGTTSRTFNNAIQLCKELKTDCRIIDIKASVEQHFKDIHHDIHTTDVVYENAQARERTQVLMDVANAENALVVGTGDLSELALGWATYNADHMSMYGVNSSVPKTLVKYVIQYFATVCEQSGESKVASVLHDILNTPVSPELLPPTEDGKISQLTENLVGPYELHDFYLYYFLRYGFTPSKIYRLAANAFAGKYTSQTILIWLRKFVSRFFSQQFKRSCLPDGPKVGSVSLSPRGDWRMPSDAQSSVWLSEIDSMLDK